MHGVRVCSRPAAPTTSTHPCLSTLQAAQDEMRQQATRMLQLRADQFQSRVAYLEDLLRTHAPHVDTEAHRERSQTAEPVHQPSGASLRDDTRTLQAQERGLDAEPSRRESLGHPNTQQAHLGEWSIPPVTSQSNSDTVPSVITDHNHTTSQSGTVLETDAPTGSATGSRIGPEQPLAHDVGLLSLGNASSDPKYLGPSSGVSFARLIYAAAPQTQGLPAATPPSSLQGQGGANGPVACIPLPKAAQMYRFAESYFDTFDHLYPFLKENCVHEMIERKCNQPPAQQYRGDLDLAILFLVAALGARNLEHGLDTDLRSGGHLASAMAEISQVQLHDSMQGVQIMLLLVLASLWFPKGLNAWYLEATIIASCLDLGLQRRRAVDTQSTARGPQVTTEEDDIRSSIFWSAYSLERTLSTTLGRPLTLRDEAIDVEFPGETGTQYSSYPATVIPSPLNDLDFFNIQSHTSVRLPSDSTTAPPPAKKARLDHTPGPDYAASRFSFRFDRITAEIKLMLYRVVQLPTRFPWPTDLGNWQAEAHEACNNLLDTARHILSSRRMSSGRARRALPAIELKYHQCILLLFRPSPAFRSPTADALVICYMSALEVIKIHAEQLRLGELPDTWLTAHTVFISGITVIYTAWVLPRINNRAAIPSVSNYSTLNVSITNNIECGIRDCSDLLAHLGRTWSVAMDAKEKFDRMSASTLERMRNGSLPFASAADTVPRQGGIHGTEQAAEASAAAGSASNTYGFSRVEDINATWLRSGDGFTFGDLLEPPDFLEQLGDFSNSYDFGWMADSTA
ncbi:hypothetical protein BU25DRAFT_446727 [Macroventuria anomochaeta]|uniref:Uncharacterized protein n=1 Tax=Macroventuria anomochaeta TaxID=301207 RepID=A0ACB6S7A0_9PLEO|nr:uncharacterized protein BU25DRAFT_446727 [Macroventuria anomochaeta]KAF2629848.1 hypothetical protein BU25DRAFT_446727 [Macroventuria anomochaeta]